MITPLEYHAIVVRYHRATQDWLEAAARRSKDEYDLYNKSLECEHELVEAMSEVENDKHGFVENYLNDRTYIPSCHD